MTTPVDAREQLIDAVRRDMYGPTTGSVAGWPGSVARVLDGPTDCIGRFESTRELVGPFEDADGNEILLGSPLRRYGIGVLYPALTAAQQQQLDRAQSEEAHAEQDDEGEPPAPLPDDGPSGHAEVDDAADEPGEINRPRSMAVSFLLTPGASSLKVTLDGGRYERVTATVGEKNSVMWRRRPVAVGVDFDTTDATPRRIPVMEGGLQLELGIEYRTHRSGTIATVFAMNRTSTPPDFATAATRTLFQATLRVEGERNAIGDYPVVDAAADEDRTLDLLYHRHPVRAIGHGCNARYETTPERQCVIGEHFPTETVRTPTPDAVDASGRLLTVGMDDLANWTADAVASVEHLLDAYQAWITDRRTNVPPLRDDLRPAGIEHLDACQRFLDDARRGWTLAQTSTDVRTVLQWTSKVMADQRRAYASSTRPLVIRDGKVVSAEGTSPHVGRLADAQWRAFQIAFLLASLPAAFDPADTTRNWVDIIWLPTGGGKTEAYSALAAFTILWQRYQRTKARDDSKQGCVVLMRYTLRLLTAQQLQRAASLICALEVLRGNNEMALGTRRFMIGAWLGRASTPNNRKDASVSLGKWCSAADDRPFLLTRCPWCSAAIGRRSGPGRQDIDGYKTQQISDGSRVMAYCPDPKCPFNGKFGLPVYEVDEDLYHQPPTFLVGTVDKFAMLSWRTDPSSFFGISAGKRTGPGPALLIQDELHLIAGPLGSLDALYEPIIEDLCVRDGGTAPRIVAATATTRRYREQTKALYGRDKVRLIPPPGLDADDNFFSRTNPQSPGKIFVAISAPGYGKAQEAQVRLLAALSHAAGSLDAAGINPDPWWTNLCFFSSRRSLGLALSLCQTHLRGHTWRLFRATGVHAGRARDTTGTRTVQRGMQARIELTAQATSDVSATMERLSVTYDQKRAADLCFATSMIEVGIDIERLGLLTMFGQPKSSSQYIQVAGRVGRNTANAPGVVFVILSPYNTRDRSHLEQFSSFHQRLYASVEPVSITPFTPAALERGLAGAMSAWLRQNHPTVLPAVPGDLLDAAVAPLRSRAHQAGPDAKDNVERQFARLAAEMDATTYTDWGRLQPNRAPDGFLRSLADSGATPEDTTTWAVPTSMRSVDTEAGARSVDRVRQERATPPVSTEPEEEF